MGYNTVTHNLEMSIEFYSEDIDLKIDADILAVLNV